MRLSQSSLRTDISCRLPPTVDHIDRLIAASLALEQMSLRPYLSGQVSQAGRETHGVHRLRTVGHRILSSNPGLCLKCIGDAMAEPATTPVREDRRQFALHG